MRRCYAALRQLRFGLVAEAATGRHVGQVAGIFTTANEKDCQLLRLEGMCCA